jgi:hypothetical protein
MAVLKVAVSPTLSAGREPSRRYLIAPPSLRYGARSTKQLGQGKLRPSAEPASGPGPAYLVAELPGNGKPRAGTCQRAPLAPGMLAPAGLVPAHVATITRIANQCCSKVAMQKSHANHQEPRLTDTRLGVGIGENCGPTGPGAQPFPAMLGRGNGLRPRACPPLPTASASTLDRKWCWR